MTAMQQQQHYNMLHQPSHMAQLPHAQHPGSHHDAPRAGGGGQPLINGSQTHHSQIGNKIYSLQIEQQPDRARMCGFGDKDRRPITPPPCIRLIVRDASTGREISSEDVDPTRFVLIVDLWDANGQQEVNLVRHSNTSPSVSISMATTTSYPPPPDAGPMRGMMGYGMDPHNPGYGGYAYGGGGYGPQASLIPTSASPQAGMFTRNLIGSTTVSASTLQDLQDNVGFWFVLQDLSVRQEGQFRLKCSFVDVSAATTSSPILASVFSEPFTVWSAKKFPGVKESTPLSKCFASQGVKIPIRKDGGKGSKGDDDED